MAQPPVSLDAAVARLCALVAPTGRETVATHQGLGRVLAEPLTAAVAQPPFAASMMDGWAVRAADLAAAAPHNPVDLRRIGEAPAGRPFAGALGPGDTVRIFTGAPLPAGADAVAMQEDVTETAAGGRFTAPVAVGRHIRPAGQDFQAGETLLPAGLRLSPAAVGLAAAANRPWLTVHRRPRVGVLATGDEIALPGAVPAAGQIVSSNAFTLAALAQRLGADAVMLGAVADDPAALRARLIDVAGLDLLVTAGGVGGGAHDVMAQFAAAGGGEIFPLALALRPCRAVVAGRLGGGVALLGLPGNPAPACMGALALLAPLLRRLSGETTPPPAPLAVRVTTPLEPAGAWTSLHLARLTRRGAALSADILSSRGAGGALALALADAMIIRPAGSSALPAGGLADAILTG